MKKTILLFLISLLCLPVKANEGMWFLMHIERLNYVDMQEMGLQLTAEEIYSINNHSLKDAIVQFGGGCTAEIISSNGLVLTNHHCGYGQIAQLSTEENDYLTNGFWAKNHAEELKPANLKVRFFVRMDDVTQRILGLVNDTMSESEREKVINQEIAKIEQENSEGGKYIVSVRSFYNGNEYYYFVYQDYSDVRLVGTPPNSIGKFGGDTDNWEWPRHTGDFALFRVYGDKDGNPAEYSPDNVPLQVKYYLPVSLKGVEEGDFAMILGYPGRTNRWMPSAGVEQNVKYAYPAWVEASKTSMDVMKKYMDANQQVNLDYASSYSSIANYWKNRQGMIDALTQHNTVKTKKKSEDKFVKQYNKKYGKKAGDQIMDAINSYYAKTNELASQRYYLMGGILRSSRIVPQPVRLKNLLTEYVAETQKGNSEAREKLQKTLDEAYEKIHLPLEKDILKAHIELYTHRVGKLDFLPNLSSQSEMDGIDPIAQFIDQVFATSIFTNPQKMQEFLDQPTLEKITADPMTQISDEIYGKYRAKSEEEKQWEEDYQRAFRKMIQGMRDLNPNTKYYPDANSTLRLTYGTVRALPLAKGKVNDALKNYYTTLEGTLAKYQPGDDEFDIPQKLFDLHKNKDYGQYADKNGQISVNFLTDHDITGGNSGSPVLNGQGELIGIAFDGNIEAMAGDVIFDPELQRAINVDIRYVLFIIDKYAGATHLIDEMTLVK